MAAKMSQHKHMVNTGEGEDPELSSRKRRKVLTKDIEQVEIEATKGPKTSPATRDFGTTIELSCPNK